MGIIDTLDRETVEGKIRHYQEILSRYEEKYTASYDAFSESVHGEKLTSEIEDDLLDWREALLMSSVYERMLGEFTKTG